MRVSLGRGELIISGTINGDNEVTQDTHAQSLSSIATLSEELEIVRNGSVTSDSH